MGHAGSPNTMTPPCETCSTRVNMLFEGGADDRLSHSGLAGTRGACQDPRAEFGLSSFHTSLSINRSSKWARASGVLLPGDFQGLWRRHLPLKSPRQAWQNYMLQVYHHAGCSHKTGLPIHTYMYINMHMAAWSLECQSHLHLYTQPHQTVSLPLLMCHVPGRLIPTQTGTDHLHNASLARSAPKWKWITSQFLAVGVRGSPAPRPQ